MTSLSDQYSGVLKGDVDPAQVLEAPAVLRIVESRQLSLRDQYGHILDGTTDTRSVLEASAVLTQLDEAANDSMEPNKAFELAAGFSHLLQLAVYDEPVRTDRITDQDPVRSNEKVA